MLLNSVKLDRIKPILSTYFPSPDDAVGMDKYHDHGNRGKMDAKLLSLYTDQRDAVRRWWAVVEEAEK